MNNNTEEINKNNLKLSGIVENFKKSVGNYGSAIICFLFAFILYTNTLNHSYVYDDNGIITNNKVVKNGIQSIPVILTTNYRYGAKNISDNIYRPISPIMFAIEWQLAPNNPFLGHLLNVLFYALSCLLLFVVLRKYMSKAHSLIPLLITLLYAAHPIHTEVVANIKSRDEIMSFFFIMLTLLYLHKWFTNDNKKGLIVSLLMFFLAFLSKEGVITMLFLFPVIGWYFTDAKPKSILKASLLLIIPAIAYISIRHLVLSGSGETYTVTILENFLLGAPDAASHFATAVMLLGKYLLLLIAPYQLVIDYSYNQIPIIGLSNLNFIISFLIYLLMGIYVILNFRKKDPIVLGLLFFLITISIYSNILFHIGTSFGERLLFLPSLGFCIAFVYLIAKLTKHIIKDKTISKVEILKTKPIFTALIFIILILFSIKTISRASDWKDETTLIGIDIKNSPNSSSLCTWWGYNLFARAEKEENKSVKDALMRQAIESLNKSLLIYPKNTGCYSQLSLAWIELGDIKKAMFYAKNALIKDTNDAITCYNTGSIYFKTGNFTKAIELFTQAINLNPVNSDAYNNRGSAKNNLKDYNGAIPDFTKAIEINPNNYIAYDNRGLAKYYLKDFNGAISDCNMAVKINPEYSGAYLNIGCILGETQKYEEAIIALKKCIELNPQNIGAYQDIALCYQSLNQPEEAKLWYEKARTLSQTQNK